METTAVAICEKNTMNDSAKQLRLKSGRMLGYALYGDPKGTPLFYFHGWPASRLSAEVYHQVAKKLHIRIISPDRPGFGLSEFQKNRTLLDWPEDIEELANHLKIKKFAIMGVSGGGPYAAVCAYKIPKRLTNVGIIVGLGPIHGPESVEGIIWSSKIGWLLFGKFSWVRRLGSISHLLAAKNEWIFHMTQYVWGKADRKLLVSKELSARSYATHCEAMRQGCIGPEHDLMLYTRDWGFPINEISTKTYLYYGALDRNVSLNIAKNYAAHIKNSVLTIFPGEGHLISITHAQEILKKLVS